MQTSLLKAPSFSVEQVESIYIGKGNQCRCGCGGDYLRVSDDPKHAKKIKHYLKKLASGNYPVEVQDGYIFEIELSKSGYDRVATFYLRNKIEI
jgi:hypothetical protein